MKKMTKKIVAIVTMMMFIVTMMPFAAFAADATGSVEKSTVALSDAVDGVVNVTTADEVTGVLQVKDDKGVGSETGLTLTGVKVWAVAEGDEKEAVAKGFKVTSVTNPDNTPRNATEVTPGDKATAWYLDADDTVEDIKDGTKFTMTFSKPGTYYVYGWAKAKDAVTGENILPSAQKVVVTEAPVDPAEVATLNVVEPIGDINLDNKVCNGQMTTQVTAYVEDAAKKAVENAEVSISADNGAVVFDKETKLSNYNGKVVFNVGFTSATSGKIAVTCGDKTEYINLTAAKDGAATDIVANNTGKAVNVDNAKENDTLESAVTFTITNKNGEVVSATGLKLTGAQYITVNEQPKTTTAKKLTAEDVTVVDKPVNGEQTATLEVKKDLVVGDYSITVVLANGAKATAEFSVAKYGKTQSITAAAIEITDNGAGGWKDVSSVPVTELLAGHNYKVIAIETDENGLTQKSKNASVGANAVVPGAINMFDTNMFTVKKGKDGKFLGTNVKLSAVESSLKLVDQQELTIVDETVAGALAFDSEQGDAAKSNTVKVTVVDENGKLVKISGDMVAYVAGQSNKDAKVSVSTQNGSKVNEGKGAITLYSDVATTADIVVAVKKTGVTEQYIATLNYTFGAKDVDADKSVVMTIGDKDFIVNNKVVTGDAAPYVANDRTYVPIRALAESFSANVDWDNDARTVTVTRGDVKVVMTVGETTYTVNGEKATMDVAPEIIGDRTYVPVRFVAEALGFTVTPFYAADGTTGSVLFQI